MSEIVPKSQRTRSTQNLLRYAALFLGELRDGLTMINMQSVFLIVSKGYDEKEVGVLFVVFGMSQFVFQTPAGYLYDYTENKIFWLSSAGALTTILTVMTAMMATKDNFWLMILIKFFQGAITSFIPPGLNSITQGIVGTVGMTKQVAVNEMMNHLGTAIIVFTGSLAAYFLYPNIGYLFIVSPIACLGFLFFLNQIPPGDIDHAAARGLTSETDASNPANGKPSSTSEYVPPSTDGPTSDSLRHNPSFNVGFGGATVQTLNHADHLKADTPLQILRDPTLLIFILVCFLFHSANGTVLPLVMQTLAIGNGSSGILLSGLCITIAQIFMVMSAKICGDFSGVYGRKILFLIGLSSVPIRCGLLAGLLHLRGDEEASSMLNLVILSTQILDGVGAGTFGTMYILVTSDVSGGTGRFGLTLGLTTAAMSIGGTVSGYLGQALAEELGYKSAFIILMFMSMVPVALYFFCMPETLPEHSKEGTTNITSIQEEAEDEDVAIAAHTAAAADNAQKTGNYVEMI